MASFACLQQVNYWILHVALPERKHLLCLPSLLTASLASRGFVFYDVLCEFVLPPVKATPLFRIAGRCACGPRRKHGRHGHEIGFRANDTDGLGH